MLFISNKSRCLCFLFKEHYRNVFNDGDKDVSKYISNDVYVCILRTFSVI